MDNLEKNRQFQLMLEPARQRLKKYTIEELCEKGNIEFCKEESEFVVSSMGQKIKVHYPDFVIKQELEMWHHLTLLQYMAMADGSSLTGKWIDLSQMRGGLSRGSGFNKDITSLFEKNFVDVSVDAFQKACQELGGVIVEGRADISVKIPFAPMFPIQINYWEGDDEFPPSGKVLVDENAEHYLTIEAAGSACIIVVNEIISLLRKSIKSLDC